MTDDRHSGVLIAHAVLIRALFNLAAADRDPQALLELISSYAESATPSRRSPRIRRYYAEHTRVILDDLRFLASELKSRDKPEKSQKRKEKNKKNKKDKKDKKRNK